MTFPQFRFISRIDDIPTQQWNAIAGTGYPFLRHEFLHALEASGCVSEASGWQPHHLVAYQGDQLVAVMPLYRKAHSYGEYVFDWAWADAYHRYGRHYYPKLLTAIPFTPATGPRLAVAEQIDQSAMLTAVVSAVREECRRLGLSSWHWLFPDTVDSEQLIDRQMPQRLGCQYHWLNRDYQNFDDFLAAFSSRKRKNLKKERRRVAEQGLILHRYQGAEITPEHWNNFYQFYHLTYFKRSGRQGYLNQAFFQQLAATMPEQIMMVVAEYQGQTVAASLFFVGEDTLYGRYWGCAAEFDFLHFEACYYQGIAYAIEHGLQSFDPGAQGEHKIQRGFTPVPTYSNHDISDPLFRDAIADFLQREAEQMEYYRAEARALLPFRQEPFKREDT